MVQYGIPVCDSRAAAGGFVSGADRSANTLAAQLLKLEQQVAFDLVHHFIELGALAVILSLELGFRVTQFHIVFYEFIHSMFLLVAV